MIDYPEAIDTLFGILDAAWKTETVIVPVPDIEWPDQISGAPRPAEKYWMRVWTRQTSDKARSIGRPAIYTTDGYMYAQIFAPLTVDKGSGKNLGLLAQLVKDAYTSKTVNGVRIISALIREMTSEAKWHSKRVAINYQFDYLK